MVWAMVFGGALLLVLGVASLVDLIRHRQTMETWQFVAWAAAILLLPLAGLISYFFWRITRSQTMQDAMDFNEERSG